MDAALVSGWTALCQQLAPAFTRPTLVTFVHLATGWVLCRSRPTVTNLVCTIGSSLLGHLARHWTVYEKFFYRAAWSLPQVSRLLLTRVVVPLIDRCAVGSGGAIDLDIDDTTCGRCGRHVASAAYFKDASASNTLKRVVHWAHNWVIGAVALRDGRCPRWVIGLPVLVALYRKRGDCDTSHPLWTRQQIPVHMIRDVRQALRQTEGRLPVLHRPGGERRADHRTLRGTLADRRMHSRRQANRWIRAGAGMVPANRRAPGPLRPARADTGQKLVPAARRRRHVGPAPSGQSLWMVAAKGSSVVSRHAGDASARLVDASNKMRLDPREPSAEIT